MIQKISDKNTFTHRWISDVERIRRVLLDNGYSSLLEDCANLWEDYSDSLCAGWINLPKDDLELWEVLKRLL